MRLGPGAIPHEKTDYNTAMSIKAILQTKVTAEEQDILLRDDEESIWFGVVRDNSAFHSFRDYGRYADLMNNHSALSSRGRTGSLSGIRDHRFPSLVSFVGQTGNLGSSLQGFSTDLT